MRYSLLVLALLAILAAGALSEESPADPHVRDLRLSAWLTSNATIVPGHSVRLGGKITNRSTATTYHLVRPGDGSECGWREPHVFFTAIHRGARDGGVPVEEKAWGRCGIYDANWGDDVVSLAPGEALDLTPTLQPASLFLDFQREGRVEIRLHYAWKGGKANKAGPDGAPPADLGAMKGVPPFELVSEPVVLRVRRPVDVSVEAIGHPRVGRTSTLADLLRVTVTNQTAKAIPFRPQSILFVLGKAEPPDLLDRREDVEPQARVRAAPLRAGEKRTFEGKTRFQLLRHLRLRARKPGVLRVAAVYAPGASDRSPDRDPTWIRSAWVELRAK